MIMNRSSFQTVHKSRKHMRVNGLIKEFKLMSKIEDQMAKVLDSTSYLRLRNKRVGEIIQTVTS